jgi:hypothetical protein
MIARKASLAVVLIACVSNVTAQNCLEIAAMAQMARAKSPRQVAAASGKAGQSYAARLIHAYRLFQLQPGTKEHGDRLLKLIPSTETQQNALMTLGDMLCNNESVADITTLARVSEGWSRELSNAVLLSPGFLPQYVQYSLLAVLDPHSDYAIQMKRVCEKAHPDFVNAVKGLPADKRQVFAKHVLRPGTCTVVAVPETKE